jgi:hypothetical protein
MTGDRGQAGGYSSLKLMLGYLATDWIPRRVACENIANGVRHRREGNPLYNEKTINTVEELAAALGYRNHSSLYPVNGKLPVPAQSLIRQLYGIDEDSQCWEYFQAGDDENFKAEYRRSHPIKKAEPQKATLAGGDVAKSSSGSCLVIEAGRTKTKVDRRFAEFAFTMAGSFEPSANADGIPMVLSLSFDRRGWPIFHDLTVRLKEVDVQLKHEHERAPESIEAFALACRDHAEGNFAATVDGLSPFWIVGRAGGDDVGLAGTLRRNDGKDCICRGFKAGDEITALMTARVSDCFVLTSGQPFDETSTAKQRFIDQLCKLDALGGAEATLGVQILKVVEKLK